MKKKKLITLLASALLILGLAVGGTIAFITVITGRNTNSFEPGQVSCQVTEDFDGTTTSNVAVTNTGNTDAFIRAKVNVTCMKDVNSGDQTVSALAPKAGTDYAITYLTDTGWIEGGDGYWYYQSPVAPGAGTGTLIGECTQISTINAPEGYHLSVEILASSIQSSPEKAVSLEWGVTLEEGKIVSANGSGVMGE